MTQTGDSANSVDFAPAGLQFASVTKLTIGYKNCPKSPTGSYRVIFVNDAMQWLEDMVSWDDNVNGRVTGDLHHFSRYAVPAPTTPT